MAASLLLHRFQRSFFFSFNALKSMFSLMGLWFREIFFSNLSNKSLKMFLVGTSSDLACFVSRLSYTTVYKAWKKLTQDEVLLNGTMLHDLRHIFATERVGLMGIEELRALLGHEHIQTTLRYQKVTSARAEEVAIKALDRLMYKSEISESS
jgi:integrase